MVDLVKARERHYALVAGVKVDILIAYINKYLWRELGGYVSAGMAMRMLAVPTLVVDHCLLLRALLDDVNTRTLGHGENRVYCDWSDANWRVAVGAGLARKLQVICKAACNAEVIVKWQIGTDTVTNGSILRQEDILSMGECIALKRGGWKIRGVVLETLYPVLKECGHLSLLSEGRKTRRREIGYVKTDDVSPEVTTGLFSHAAVTAALTVMREIAIEDHKG